MSTARDDVLARIRASLQGDAGPPPAIVRAYDTTGVLAPGARALVDLFENRLVDYKATVVRTTTSGICECVASVLASRQAQCALVVPAGLDASWYAGLQVLIDSGGTTWAQLDAADAVLTGCAIAIAETGTIVLDSGPEQGRRAISLVPDLHVCVVRVEQIVEKVPDALRILDGTRPLTFISGGSATSDIELQRVEGVHGPRSLVVLIVNG